MFGLCLAFLCAFSGSCVENVEKMWKTPPVKTSELLNELVGDHKKLTVNGVQFFLGMISLLKEGPAQKTTAAFYHASNPPLFPPLLLLPFPFNGFLSEMQMFSRVTLLRNIVE